VLITELAAKMARLHGLKPIVFANPKLEKPGPGEIGIVFTKLRPGEKLHEELLIGGDSRPTMHPRIMAANESRQPPEELFAAIEQLALACDRNDIPQIHKIMIEQQTAYRPSLEIADQFWHAAQSDALASAEKPADKPVAEPPRLTLVRS
jgi:FlaA1/EpsC-like NDP-sugar epimerase